MTALVGGPEHPHGGVVVLEGKSYRRTVPGACARWLNSSTPARSRAVRATVDANQLEVTEIIQKRELVVARADNSVVGAERAQRLSDQVGEFGMLVADPAQRGIGIGRVLVAFAEQWAREQGLRWMQLELLVPHSWAHPTKEFRRDWYTRIGHRKVRTARLEEAYPALQPRLTTECDFVIYHKDLQQS